MTLMPRIVGYGKRNNSYECYFIYIRSLYDEGQVVHWQADTQAGG